MDPQLPPQPPPDAPAPPPGDEARDSQLKMKMICVVGAAAVLFALYVLIIALPLSRRATRIHNARNKSEATNNIRQVHLALMNFDSDYGEFPGAATIPDVQSQTGTTLALGSASSNELFRQLIASGTSKSERIFWAWSAGTPRAPNEILGGDTLKKGECSFTYIAGLSSSSPSDTPVAMAPVIPGTWKFDPKPFDGKAVVLRVDGSAKSEPIDKHGDVMIGGMNLFDPRQPYWGGKAPDIKWPE